jgi:hypothetical protein
MHSLTILYGRVPRRKQKILEPTTPITVEHGKATIEVMAFTVKDFVEQHGVLVLTCPKCKRRIGIAPGKPYRHTCGATIIAQKEGA